MTPFVQLEIETDRDAVIEEILELIRDTYPNFQAAKGSLERLIIEGMAEEIVVQRFQMQEVSEIAPRPIATIAGVPPKDPTQAVGEVLWTFTTTTGHLIEEGTEIALTGPDGSDLSFAVSEEVTVPVDEATATVSIEAIEEGAAGSGLSGTAELLSDIADVESIEVIGVTTGGQDGETVDEFLNTWSDRMLLISDRLHQDVDFARYYRTAVDACARAVAIDNYNPADDTYDNEGMVTVVGHDIDGEPLSSEVKIAAQAAMEENTVAGLIVHVEDPTYNEIDVDVEFVALPGYVLEDLASEVETALNDYLAPQNRGNDPTGSDPTAWINDLFVRYLEVAEATNNVPGVHYILEPTLEINGLYNTDAELTGFVPLTRPGTINVTAHPPGYDGSS